MARTSSACTRELADVTPTLHPAGRLALSDALLAVLTVAMLGCGLWDWLAPHPMRIRWPAITGVLLAGHLIGHTVRRRHRLTRSRVR